MRRFLAAALVLGALQPHPAPAAEPAAAALPAPVQRFFAALEARDLGMLEAALAERAVTVLPMNASGSTAADETRRFEGRAATLRYYGGAMQAIGAARFLDAEATVGDGGRTVVVENRGEMRLASGETYRNLCVWRFDVDDGRVVAIREYFNPVAAAIAFRRPLGPQPAAR